MVCERSTAALGSAHDAVSIGTALLKRSATATTILAEDTGFTRIGTFGAIQKRVARIEQKWQAVLGQKGTYRRAINAYTKPKVQNCRREPLAFDDLAWHIEHASC
jgi:hypothetical protein